MIFLYNIFISIYFIGIKLASYFRKDAQEWVEGRKNVFKNLASSLHKFPDAHFIWIHCASLGEFEQGRTLIEKIKKNHSAEKICLSFFSPSGYQTKEHYEYADIVCYWPSDSLSDVHHFLDILKPKWVIFVKYEFWWNTIIELQKRKIPLLFISSVLHSKHYLRKPFFHVFLKILMKSNHIFLQDISSYNFLKEQGFQNISLDGDTRLDRVIEIQRTSKEIPIIQNFLENHLCFIAGSVWKDDLDIVVPAIEKNESHWKFILVPHKPDEIHLSEIELLLTKSNIRYSHYEPNSDTSYEVLIFDKMGFLSSLYQYADLCYIGGGFKTGLHNILEPVSHRKCVLFGPNHQKFPEAQISINSGFGFEVKNQLDIELKLKEFQVDSKRKQIEETIPAFLVQYSGATDKIYRYLYAQGLLE